MEKIKFSVVLPVKDEVNLLLRTLPSYCSLYPDEILICTDKPCNKNIKRIIPKMREKGYFGKPHPFDVKIIEVEKSNDWLFHQVHVRRTGFDRARNDIIVTGDIDLVVNRNIYKAINMVGKNNVGLVSLSKRTVIRTFVEVYRNISLMRLIRNLRRYLKGAVTFTGLYVFYKPYWLDTEKRENVKRLANPKQFKNERGKDLSSRIALSGEDSYLLKCMEEKYKCIFLSDIGAVNLGRPSYDFPQIQFLLGIKRGKTEPLIFSLVYSVLWAYPYYFYGRMKSKALNTT